MNVRVLSPSTWKPNGTTGVEVDSCYMLKNIRDSCRGERGTGQSQTWVLFLCVLSHFSRVRLFTAPWTVAHQAPLSMVILQARILEWLPLPTTGYLPDPGIEPASLMSPALGGRFFTTSATVLA